ncbi:UNVERIFIED_CONTAM: hypothetical protein FKN15_052296 [Acipenser sinensis]
MLPQVSYPPSPRGDQGEREEVSQLAQEDTFSTAASFSSDMEVGGEPEPPAVAESNFEVASEASVPPLSSSISALMGHTAAFLHVPWMPEAEPCRSVFRKQSTASRPYKLLAFMEETAVAVTSEVPDKDKAVLLDEPISPGHTLGPAVEILQRSHQECEASRQVDVLLPPLAPAWGRLNRWQAPPTWTVTRTVAVPTALLGDLRHHLQGTTTENNQTLPRGRGNAVAKLPNGSSRTRAIP